MWSSEAYKSRAGCYRAYLIPHRGVSINLNHNWHAFRWTPYGDFMDFFFLENYYTLVPNINTHICINVIVVVLYNLWGKFFDQRHSHGENKCGLHLSITGLRMIAACVWSLDWPSENTILKYFMILCKYLHRDYLMVIFSWMIGKEIFTLFERGSKIAGSYSRSFC